MKITQVPAHPNNYSKNLGANQLRKIVLHWIVGELSAADATFQNPERRASAHYGIGSNGAVHQYVADKNIAWHAGPKVNYESLGIEHAGGQLINGGRKKPTQKCHDTSAELIAMLCKKYGIPIDRNHIRKHSEYMPTQCPGTLDIDYIIKKANEINKPQPLDYELYTKDGNIYAHFKSGSYDGQYVMRDADTGNQTDSGNIFMSQGTHDRIVSPNYTKRRYKMTFGNVVRGIDLSGYIPPVPPAPPEDPCKDVKTNLIKCGKEKGLLMIELEQVKPALKEANRVITKLEKQLKTCKESGWIKKLIEIITNLFVKKDK